LEGTGYTIEGEDLFENLDNINYEFLIRFDKDTNSDNIWSFGHPFLSEYTVVFNGEEKHVGFHGGETIDLEEEWNEWNKPEPIIKNTQFFYLIVGASILGGLLLIAIIFIIVHSLKRRRLEEHGPLINDQN